MAGVLESILTSPVGRKVAARAGLADFDLYALEHVRAAVRMDVDGGGLHVSFHGAVRHPQPMKLARPEARAPAELASPGRWVHPLEGEAP